MKESKQITLNETVYLNLACRTSWMDMALFSRPYGERKHIIKTPSLAGNGNGITGPDGNKLRMTDNGLKLDAGYVISQLRVVGWNDETLACLVNGNLVEVPRYYLGGTDERMIILPGAIDQETLFKDIHAAGNAHSIRDYQVDREASQTVLHGLVNLSTRKLNDLPNYHSSMDPDSPMFNEALETWLLETGIDFRVVAELCSVDLSITDEDEISGSKSRAAWQSFNAMQNKLARWMKHAWLRPSDGPNDENTLQRLVDQFKDAIACGFVPFSWGRTDLAAVREIEMDYLKTASKKLFDPALQIPADGADLKRLRIERLLKHAELAQADLEHEQEAAEALGYLNTVRDHLTDELSKLTAEQVEAA